MRFSRLVILLVLSLGFVSQAFAMRCGDKLVIEGDSKYSVEEKCGEPLDKQTIEQTVPLYNEAGYQIGVNTFIVETWIYQKSSADFQYELIFDGGIVKQINANRNP